MFGSGSWNPLSVDVVAEVLEPFELNGRFSVFKGGMRGRGGVRGGMTEGRGGATEGRGGATVTDVRGGVTEGRGGATEGRGGATVTDGRGGVTEGRGGVAVAEGRDSDRVSAGDRMRFGDGAGNGVLVDPEVKGMGETLEEAEAGIVNEPGGNETADTDVVGIKGPGTLSSSSTSMMVLLLLVGHGLHGFVTLGFFVLGPFSWSWLLSSAFRLPFEGYCPMRKKSYIAIKKEWCNLRINVPEARELPHQSGYFMIAKLSTFQLSSQYRNSGYFWRIYRVKYSETQSVFFIQVCGSWRKR
jgi:hypothetical protein